MGCYLTELAISMSIGALVWGQVAGWLGLATTQWIAAATLVVTTAIGLRIPIGGSIEPRGSQASMH